MTLTIQFQTLLSMIGTGIGIGICFDTYCRFLERPKKWRFFYFVTDMVFWLVQALLCFLILLSINEGELRFYLFLALLLGYATYEALFKQLYLRLLERIIYIGIRLYQWLKRVFFVLIIKPILILWTFLMVLFTNIVKVIIKIGIVIYRILFYCIKLLYRIVLFFIPKKMQKYVYKYLSKYAGLWKKIKNRLSIAKTWIGKLKERFKK